MKKAFLFVLVCFALSALCIGLSAAGATVVYLRDGGGGNGSSPAAAVGRLTDAYAALDLSKNCTVVVCGGFTQSDTFDCGTDYTGSVTLTSVYGGVDYRAEGALFCMAPTFFVCRGETRFENMDFAAGGENYIVVGQHHPVTVGDGVTVTGEKMTTGTIPRSFCIFGGYYKGVGDAKTEESRDTNITVLSGAKFYLIPFSRNMDGNYTGTAHMHIGGSVSVPVVHGSCVGSDTSSVGRVEVTVSDNAKIRSFYGATSPVKVRGYVFTWTGGSIGEIQWNCKPTPAANIQIAENTVLYAPLSVQARSDFVKNAAVFDAVRTAAEVNPLPEPDPPATATVVYLRDGGSGSGVSAETAVGSLTAAYKALDLSKDCTVVLCGTFTQEEDFDFGADYTGSVTLTSVCGGVDYRSVGAVWRAGERKFICYGDTRFENLNFLALGASMHVIGQHHPITVGEGVGITGDKMTTGTLSRSFSIYGGYYAGAGRPRSVDNSDTNITVLSGQKIYILAFSCNMAGEYTGTAHITVGGSANVPVVHCSCVGVSDNRLGSVDLTVKDGAVIRSIYGATSPVKMRAATLTWLGGSFRELQWNCGATPAADLVFEGATTLRASDTVRERAGFAATAALFDRLTGPDEAVSDAPVKEVPSIRSDFGCARGLFLLGLAQGYDTTGTNF